jgi:nucleoside transporter
MNQPGSSSVAARLSVMMFLQFFVWGAWYVSMTGWMGVQKLDGLIGWAYTVGPIAAVISPLFLGMIADRFFPTQRVLGAMHLLGGVALLAIPKVIEAVHHPVLTPKEASFFHPFVLLAFAHMLCYMPTLGLTNTLAFHHMTNPEKQFPLVRVFGTIGWIAGNIAVSGNLKTWGLDLTWIAEGDKSPLQFYIAGGAGLLLGLFSFSLPHTPPPAAGKKVRIGELFGLDSLKLLSRSSYAVFVVCSFLICIPLAGYYAYARNFVDFVGFKNATITMSYGQMSEIVFMLLMPLFFKRLGVKWMLAVGMLAWMLRYGLFAMASGNKDHAMTVAGVMLHGICYDFFFVTGFLYVDRIAPKEIRGQAQGFLVLITQGLGLGFGAQAFAALVGHYSTVTPTGSVLDWKSIWMAPAAFALAVAVVFVLAFRDRTTKEAA